MARNKQKKDLRDTQYSFHEPKATKVRNWLLLGVEVLLLLVVGFYAIQTYELRKGTEETVKLINKEINLSLEPRLSLGGHQDEAKYIEYINNIEGYSESDITKYTEAARLIPERGGYFYFFKNISPNTAFQVVLIGYEIEERKFSISHHVISYILPGSKAMTFLEKAEGETELRENLINIYERDVLLDLRNNCVFEIPEGSWCFVVLYLDYNNNLYAVRRPGVEAEGEGTKLYLTKYYNLGKK